MTDEPDQIDHAARIVALEQELATIRAQSNSRVLQSELKAEAIRAGIVDLDLLKLLDSTNLKVNEDGSVPEAASALARLKQDKPWAFGRPNNNSSHPALPPAPELPKVKLAKEMTTEEWRTARAALIKRHAM